MVAAGVIGAEQGDLLGEPVKTGRSGAIPKWAARYGYSVRQIKNWRADGLAKQQPCPLDFPAKLPEWFESVYSKKAPAKLLAAIEKMTGQPVAAAADPEKSAVEAPAPFVMPDITGHALGVEADLARFKQSSARVHALYDQAIEKGEFTRAQGLMNQAREISGEIRQLEKLLPSIKEAAGEWMRTNEVKKTTTEFLAVLYRSLDTHGTRAADRLRGLQSDAEITRVWRDEVRTVLGRCCAAQFQEVLTLAAE